MRPIKLTLSAFGPYANEEVIDFDKLGTSGIYLISGNTGSGKTMIFDAIVYALYGKSSGGKREAKDFRSKFADPATPTFVELEFDYNGKKYKIRRNPEYERLAKKGSSSTTKQSAGVDLTLPDGHIVSKESEVRIEINNILHINEEQFKQIIMIAQNSFAKVLQSKTKEREEIFRTLFNTEKYDKLHDRMSKKNDDANTKYQGKLHDIYIILKTNEIIDTEERDFAVSEDYSAQFGDMISNTSSLISDIDDKIKAIVSQISDIDKSLGQKEKDKQTIVNYIQNKSGFDKSSIENENNKKALEISKQNNAKTHDLKQSVIRIQDSLPKYEQLDKAVTICTNLSEKIAVKSKDFAGVTKQIDDTGHELVNAQTKNKELENIHEDELILHKENQRLNDLYQLCDNTIKKMNEFKKNSDKLQIDKNDLDKKLSDLKVLQEEYNDKNIHFLAQQAGIIAKDLQEGKPCPVCGSLTHPNIARLPDNAPTQSELKKLNEDLEKQKQIAETLSQQCNKLSGKTDEQEKDLEVSFAALNETFGQKLDYNSSNYISENDMYRSLFDKIMDLQAETANKKNNIQSKISQIEKNKILKEKLQKEIEEKTNILEHLKQEKEKLNIDLNKLKSDLDNSIKQKEQFQKELTFHSKTDAESEITKLKKQINEIEKAFEEASKAFAESQTRLASYLSAMNENLASLGNPEKPDEYIENFNDRYNSEYNNKKTLIDEQKKLENEKSKYQTKLTNLKNAENRLQKELQDIKQLVKRKIMLNNLYDTINGSLKSQERISFETFVQAHYFEKVIYRANKRLSIMCDGKYKLVRRTTGSLKGQSGLDLDIKDFYNGQTRDVNTLSGGETFKASLALAFGLSDEIQMSSGGIRLDSMFVDEGFGTLDHESVSWALNALNTVATDNRLIGIISHVDELKTSIDKQIQVTKDNQGISTVNIIV